MAQDDDRRRPRLLVGRGQATTLKYLNAPHGEKIADHDAGRHPLGHGPLLAQRNGPLLTPGKALEGADADVERGELRERRRPAIHRILRIGEQNPAEPLRAGKGKRLEHEKVHETEDDGIGTDSQGQREHRRSRKARRFANQPDAVFEIPEQAGHITVSQDGRMREM